VAENFTMLGRKSDFEENNGNNHRPVSRGSATDTFSAGEDDMPF